MHLGVESILARILPLRMTNHMFAAGRPPRVTLEWVALRLTASATRWDLRATFRASNPRGWASTLRANVPLAGTCSPPNHGQCLRQWANHTSKLPGRTGGLAPVLLQRLGVGAQALVLAHIHAVRNVQVRAVEPRLPAYNSRISEPPYSRQNTAARPVRVSNEHVSVVQASAAAEHPSLVPNMRSSQAGSMLSSLPSSGSTVDLRQVEAWRPLPTPETVDRDNVSIECKDGLCECCKGDAWLTIRRWQEHACTSGSLRTLLMRSSSFSGMSPTLYPCCRRSCRDTAHPQDECRIYVIKLYFRIYHGII